MSNSRISRGWSGRTIAVAIVAAALVSATAVAGTASASVTDAYLGTTTSAATCNYVRHNMTMHGSVALSSRFPQGAYVTTRYAYRYVNAAGQAISGYYTTGWLNSWAGPATTYSRTYDVVGGEYYYQSYTAAVPLPSYTINTGGLLQVKTQVGVWNGSRYEFGSWDQAAEYVNFNTPNGNTLVHNGSYPGSLCRAS